MKTSRPTDEATQTLSQGYSALEGRYDEWKNSVSSGDNWAALLQKIDVLGEEGVSDLMRSGEDLLRESGVTLTGEPESVSRSYTLDPIPLLLSAKDFQFIEAAVKQRAHLLNKILKDCYTEQHLLKSGQLPVNLVYGQDGYNRALVKSLPDDANFLSFYALDLGRNENGQWVVMKDFTHAPKGLGIALQNRIATANFFSDLAKEKNLMRIAQFLQQYRRALLSQAPAGIDSPLIVLISSKVHDSSYFEDAFLCQYLGIPIVEGGELTVRDERLYLKTVSGLKRVHVLINRISQNQLDPLTAPAISHNGVPGLMHVMRGGNVSVINSPGAEILEASSLYSFLPKICKSLTGEALLMPSVEEENISLSMCPAWDQSSQSLHPRAVKMRFYAFFNGEDYEVMTGGIAQYSVAKGEKTETFDKDIWVISSGDGESAPHESHIQKRNEPKRSISIISSKAADNLFWLGRYAERAESVTRAVLEIVLNITDKEQRVDLSSIHVLLKVLESSQFLNKDKVSLEELPKDRELLFERLCQIFFEMSAVPSSPSNSVPYLLNEISRLISLSRARLSNEVARPVRRIKSLTLSEVPQDFSGLKKTLQESLLYSSAFKGTCLSNLTRTRGWHFIVLGQRIEAMSWLLKTIDESLDSYPHIPSSYLDSMLSVNDTTLTYRFRYQSSPQLACVLDLLLYDPDNPRSLHTHLSRIEQSLITLRTDPDALSRPLELTIRRALHFLETEFIRTETDEEHHKSILAVLAFVKTLKAEIPLISEKLGWEFFTHVDYKSF